MRQLGELGLRQQNRFPRTSSSRTIHGFPSSGACIGSLLLQTIHFGILLASRSFNELETSVHVFVRKLPIVTTVQVACTTHRFHLTLYFLWIRCASQERITSSPVWYGAESLLLPFPIYAMAKFSAEPSYRINSETFRTATLIPIKETYFHSKRWGLFVASRLLCCCP